MSRNQQGVVLFLTLLLCLFFFGSSPPSLWHHGESSGIDRIWQPNRIAAQGVWVEVDGLFPNRGVYPVEKGQTVRDVLAKARELREFFPTNPESLVTKVEQSGRLILKPTGEGKEKFVLRPLEPLKMRVLSLPVNINTANMEELDILPGIGPKTAQAIIAHRESYGRFSEIDELLHVKGIGPKKFASLRSRVTVRD